MAHAEATITIDRPAEEVFDFLADGTTNRRWRSGVLDISKTSGDGLGAVYRQTMRGPGGRKIDGDYRVTGFDRPTRLAFEVIAGPARPTGSYELRPGAPTSTSVTSTSVTFALDLRPRGLMKLMGPMINRLIRKEVAAISELKRVIEETF